MVHEAQESWQSTRCFWLRVLFSQDLRTGSPPTDERPGCSLAASAMSLLLDASAREPVEHPSAYS
eukprot:2121005-Pyramimonas_sp.AAC.1